MLQSRHIVVADYPGDRTETLYQGPDSVAAEKSKEQAIAKGEALAVVVYHNPIFSQVRYPLQEKLDAEGRAIEAERLLNSEALRKKTEAQQKRERAKQLSAEAKKLETEAAQHLDSNSEK